MGSPLVTSDSKMALLLSHTDCKDPYSGLFKTSLHCVPLESIDATVMDA